MNIIENTMDLDLIFKRPKKCLTRFIQKNYIYWSAVSSETLGTFKRGNLLYAARKVASFW